MLSRGERVSVLQLRTEGEEFVRLSDPSEMSPGRMSWFLALSEDGMDNAGVAWGRIGINSYNCESIQLPLWKIFVVESKIIIPAENVYTRYNCFMLHP